MNDLSDVARTVLIVKSLADCGEPISRSAVEEQFRYETGRKPGEDVLKKAMPRGSTVAVVKNPDSPYRKKVKEAKEEPSAPPPLWSDVHGLTKSGIDGMVLIALGLQDQIKSLTEQLAEVKAEVFGEMERARADRVRMEDGATVNLVKPEPYLGSPKREKLVQLGVAAEVIDKACEVVKPTAYVKIVAGGGE